MSDKIQNQGFNNALIESIKAIVLNGRKKVIKDVNRSLIETYWYIGKEIFEDENRNGTDSKTSRKVIL